MSIRKIENGEHSFRKPACAEYCYIAPEFCPLCNIPAGNGTKPLSIKTRRWTDIEEKTVYSVDYSAKLTPADQLPRQLPGQEAPEKPTLPKVEEIPDYAEKIKHEHESFTPFCCWGDGSGFERDIMPENLLGPEGPMERLYDLSYYPVNTAPMQLGDWNTWIDKFQMDYRFGQVSDLNAETVLFPNVDDPWMFTEYIFKGAGSGEAIVEPPLYDENSLMLKNADKAISKDASQEVREKYGLTFKNEPDEPAQFVKSYRQVCNWDELNGNEDRRGSTNFPSKDAGGRLYRADINVESVKWGEHGNVPPNTVNMGAPADWMDAAKTAARIKPTYVAHIGTPYYASTHGVVYWHDRDAYVDALEGMTPVNEDRPYYTYTVKETGPNGVKQNTPKCVYPNAKSGRNGAKLVNTYLSIGSISHGGCQFLKSRKSDTGTGKCWCSAMDPLKDDDTELNTLRKCFNFARCSAVNSECPKFVAGPEFPILADYEGVAYDKAQYNEAVLGVYSGEGAEQRSWADSFLENSTGFPAIDMIAAGGFYNRQRYGRSDIYNPTEVAVWYEAKFEVVYESENPVRLNKQLSSGNGFGRGIQVLRGTGRQALDTYENSNAFRGDTVFFGDMDQMGFSRWFETPMFCAKAAYCNDICGIAMQSGWDPSERAGSSEGACRYYRSAGTKGASGHIGCPTTCVQKRAFEFQQTMTTCTPVILSIARMWNAMSEQEREDFNENTENAYFFELQGAVNGAPLWKVWARSKEIGSDLGGVMIKESKENLHLFAKIHLAADPQGYFWYQSMDNAGAAKDVWFCKCDKDFAAFTRNTLIITNEDKFIGGYHPQYKDYSKIGKEFLQEVDSDSYRDAMGDIIGDADYDGAPQATNKKGYWTDASGDYVVGETSIGADVPIPSDDSRKEPGSPLTISFRKRSSFFETETGKMTKPRTSNCAVHANDPFSLITEFGKFTLNPSTGQKTGRPMLEDEMGSSPYWAPPFVSNKWALPTMRMAAHCPVCDYYLAWRYHDLLCPWCGTRLERIEGSKGEGIDAGSTWPQNASIIRKFFKLNAIGRVQVWAPPGTCIPRDGYFWKNPTVVTNTLIRQIKYRLGEYKDNGWQANKMSAAAEFSLGYPEQTGCYMPVPDYESEKADSGEIWENIKWTGVSREDRSRYASYNEIAPQNTLPGFASDTSNEAVIVPYTDASNDGLKMITVAEIIALRNRIQPVLAYSSDLPGQGDYPRTRASYEKREVSDVPRYISRSHCRVPSVVLAANDTGVDSNVQFWSGDREWGTVREYYPPGLSWWWLNQVIGSRYSDLTGGVYHMDGASPYSGGHRTVAKCAMFIHGILPLDKEILAAYVILSPAGEPYKEPIGRGWNGLMHYNHFHALTEDHCNDGAQQHLHGQAGSNGEYDENGVYHSLSELRTLAEETSSPIVPMDESDYREWAEKSNRPPSYRSLYVSDFISTWTGLPGVRDEGFWKQYGTAKDNVNSSNDPVYSYNGDMNSGLAYSKKLSGNSKNEMKFKLIGTDRNGDLRQNYATDDIWQTMTQKELRERADRALVDVEFSASDGNRENDIKADFVQYTNKFISATLPEQMQSIPGYFDFSGINSERRLSDVIKMKSKAEEPSFNKPVIIQENEGGSTSYSGHADTNQAGIINRVFDITDLFKTHYNERIDRRFYCDAGKTLDEVSRITFGPPKWEGVGEWEKRAEAEKWNSQEKGSFPGYLLNDDCSFPKLESDRSIPGIPSEGEQYELAPGGIQLLCTFLLPFTIKEGSNKYWISENGRETEVKSLPAGNRITTPEAAAALLESMFGSGYRYTIVSSSSCLIEKNNAEDSDTLEIKEVYGSCYGYFSIPAGTISGIQDRVAGVTSYASGFYPSRLARGGSWITNSYIFEMQNVVFDLCRAPLEESERDYRYQAPTINCASCTCPNTSCPTQGRAVGVHAELKGTTFRDGQTTCPSCGADLSGQPGVVKKNGDGLYSWYYQDVFEESPFITGMEISVDAETSFRISCRNPNSSTWTSLLNVSYDDSSKKYSCCLNNAESSVSELPARFSLDQEHWIRARYIQIEVDPKKGIEELEYINIEKLNDFSVKAFGNFREMGLFDWSGLKCIVSYGNSEETRILSAVNLNDEETELTFYFQTSLKEESIEKLIVRPNRYTSKVNLFKVFGFHYKASDLTMTGNSLEKFFLFSAKKSAYQLEEFPTQILSVSIGKNDSGGIKLTEIDDKSALQYQLAAKNVPVLNSNGVYEDHKIYVIQSGSYYFDPVHNRIYLPASGVYGGKTIDLNDFESSIAGIKENITFLPSKMSVRYWTGSGEPVTLSAQAEYQGPSFQVEKDTITFIETELPDNGTSAKMPDMSGNIARRPIPWVCYNHVPSTLTYYTQTVANGMFSVPKLASTTLGTTVDNDKFFVDQFGEHCRYVRGTCKTEVTFYGAPDQILSGRIWIKAPAYTTKVINTGAGSVTMRERTGGIARGCFVFKAVTKECKGRKTLAWNKPTIVVYAKDRNPTDEF